MHAVFGRQAGDLFTFQHLYQGMRLDYIPKNVRYWLLRQPASTVARHFDRLNATFWRYPIHVGMDPNRGTLLAQDDETKIHFVHPERLMRYARNGIQPFLNSLISAYMIDRVKFSKGDWVIDCGANIGEISMALLSREPSLNVVAIEPENPEAQCADANIYGGYQRTLRKVLWHEETVLRFYSSPQTADSSLFEPPAAYTVREVPATTLDVLVPSLGAERIRLLKLEAEGAEPEILWGAEASLAQIDYIAADLGPERGMKQEQTATPVINFLLARGFDLLDMNIDRVTCLFRNRRAVD